MIPPFSQKIYPCATRNCEGNTTHKGCKEGSLGPMCGVCAGSYFMDAVENTCVDCKSTDASRTFVHTGVVIGILALLVMLACRGNMKRCSCRNNAARTVSSRGWGQGICL